ncbi:SAV_915 family protein [Rhodococcus sp. NPDC058521]|uniref:SAV_915 family protein n=1 Tax=Rhodococcus sp. NPDC058521 TaxID=3346536 RepID=UPI0036600237
MSGGSAPQSWLVDPMGVPDRAAATEVPVEEVQETTVGGALPGVVVVPAHPILDRGREASVQLELFDTEKLGAALVAFSNVAKLVERLGAHQPWMMLPGTTVLGLAGKQGIDAVVVDPAPDVLGPVWTEQSLRRLKEANGG